ncbi:winged helix-turn-helix transcriptional regulator [Qingshengfaniella alkalisoli]|uniref:Helix-turn-helix transcriptional regulator n=1 Tax=Qingshengfaniella alkalisoli TaxID=2599296 RepID=A0A5B8IXE1_9RHOB|nr:helix-turn-helix domain-containing protein [Qingshengfaniella alkalisoli]QDY70374.1 helix-turn-helix transcriptional regulator [Qingshengfaniella alkalisoli]
METTPDDTPSEKSSPAGCPSDAVLRLLWGQWKTHVIYILGAHGPQRFGALRRTIAGISPKVLTQRLRELEADGLVWREQAPTIPPEVTYGLTELGRQIHGVLQGFDAIASR